MVTGVLVALALQAVYQHSEARKRERDYLRQMRAELRQTEASLLYSDSVLEANDHAGIMLVRAYRTNTPRDSILQWLAVFTAGGRGRPVLGTAEALVASGDLRLIRDDSLRAAIPTYIARTRNAVEALSSLEDEFQRQRESLSGVVDANQAAVDAIKQGNPGATGLTATSAPRDSRLLGTRFADTAYTPLPTTIQHTPFPIDVEAMLRDRAAYRALDRMAWANWAHRAIRRRIRTQAEELRIKVEQLEPH